MRRAVRRKKALRYLRATDEQIGSHRRDLDRWDKAAARPAAAEGIELPFRLFRLLFMPAVSLSSISPLGGGVMTRQCIKLNSNH
jgi:hypothetical protein